MRPSELELQKCQFNPENNPEAHTNTTASTTPSETVNIENPIHQHTPINLSETFNEAVTPQIHSIADRIRPSFEIHLSPEEEVTHSIVHDVNWSFITPIGLQQYDYELKKITVVLSVDELQNLGLGEFIEEAKNLRFDEEAHLSYDELVEAKKKTNINDRLTLEQWKNLEIALIKSPYGRTVIGYSINEEVYLKFWGHVFQLYYQSLKHLGYPARDYQYPPRKDDTEKLMLDLFQKKFIKDIKLSNQVAGYTSWLTMLAFLYIYSFLELKNGAYNFEEIYNKFTGSFLIFSSCLLVISLFTLQTSCLEHRFIQQTFNKFCNINHSLIGNIYRLQNYLPLIIPNLSYENLINIIVYASPIIFFISVYLEFKKNNLSQNIYTNINKYSYPKLIYYAFSWSSFNQSLLSLGSSFIVNLAFYFNDDDSSAQKYEYIMNVLFYSYGNPPKNK